MKKTCLVIFPVYKPLDQDEQMSVRQAVVMTQGFDCCFIAPQSFIMDDSYREFDSVRVERFDDRYFAGLQGYNRLMLDQSFYKRFVDYQYILIHQTDAYIFKPELEYWCSKDYDYIGAPWYVPRKLPKYNLYKFVFNWGRLFFGYEKLLHWRYNNNAGNGGLSLRKVESFINVLEKVNKKTAESLSGERKSFFHEDIFWSLEAQRIKDGFMIPE